jgi:glycosyltransferase involved in cell wall biosynthesis
MKIALVTPRYPPNVMGGGEISAKLLAEQLVSQFPSIEVTVYTIDGVKEERVNDVHIKRLGDVSHKLIELSNVYFLYKALKEKINPSIDVLHAYNMELHPSVGCISNYHNIPSIGSLNSYRFFKSVDINTKPDLERRLYEIMFLPTTGRILKNQMKRLDRYTALSKATKNVYIDHGFSGEKIAHVPNMIDTSFAVKQSDKNTPDGVTKLTYIGGLRPSKGVKYLVRAMNWLPPSFKLRIVGDGKERAKLEKLTSELGLMSQISFAGSVPYESIVEEYARTDVFVHPGVWPEPGNRTTLEAMQAGLPVVCTDIGGPPELLPQEDLVCSVGDPQDIAEKIEKAADRKGEIGEENRKHVIESYPPEKIAKEYVSEYKKVSSMNGLN